MGLRFMFIGSVSRFRTTKKEKEKEKGENKRLEQGSNGETAYTRSQCSNFSPSQ